MKPGFALGVFLLLAGCGGVPLVPFIRHSRLN